MKSTKYAGLDAVQKAVRLHTGMTPHGVDYSADGSITIRMQIKPSHAECSRIERTLGQPVNFLCEEPSF